MCAMLNREESEILIRVGSGTPMGSLLRRYWVPACFSSQLPAPDCPPVRVKLMCEKLVAFRDTKGRVGLLDERCPHRTASLFFGRNEDCGLRCVYHGWKFDVNGACIDMPSEPAGSNFMNKVRVTAYPCVERGGVVWTYMGPPEKKPEFPDLEWTMVPESHRFVTRHIQESNWLQAFEGGFDTSHLTFLHGGTVKPTRLPSVYDVAPMDFGFVAVTGRDMTDGTWEWTANVMLMPFHKIIASNPMGAHAWVPIDDETTMNWCIDFNPLRPFTDADLERSKAWRGIHTRNIPGTDCAAQNKANDYLIDRALQKSGTSYTGIFGLGVQDCGIQESMGPIADRTIEHLGVSDTIIIKLRRLLLQTLDEVGRGKEPPGLEPRSWRVRSARYKLPSGRPYEYGFDAHVRVREAAPAK
jgi:phthalate 4,5-dioxygenase